MLSHLRVLQGRNPFVIFRSLRRALRAAMRSMRFFYPMALPRRLSRVDQPTFCAHRCRLTDRLRSKVDLYLPKRSHLDLVLRPL
jgi:hypothetical protein